VQQFSDLRDAYIARVVSGRTFAEVGGLWGTVNEKVSVAHQHGATSLAMIDVTPAGGELWIKFRERMAELRVPNVHEICGDICQVTNADVAGPFDVVHCSGVLYHHPNPLVMLAALRRITRKHLVLTSAVTQTVIENEYGRYEIPPSGVLFVPALSEKEREIMKTYWQKQGVSALGLTEGCEYSVDEFAPWWWLPTPTAMAAMCGTVGFKMEDGGPTWGGNSYTLLLSAQERS
jgi:SAM-dependent methyltransferase